MTHTIEENEQRRAVIGIDVSKDKFDACCIDGNGKELFRVSAPMDSTGFDGLAQKIRTHGLIQGNVVAGWNPQVVII